MQNLTKKKNISKKCQIFYSDDDDIDSYFIKKSEKTKIETQNYDEFVQPKIIWEKTEKRIQSNLKIYKTKQKRQIRQNLQKKQMDPQPIQSQKPQIQESFNSNNNILKQQRRLLNSQEVEMLLYNIRKNKQNKSKLEKQDFYSKYDKNRKIRTPVSEQKILLMEHLFPFIFNGQSYKGTQLTLKDIAKLANLGYSTVLHKYKNFRDQGNVQKGVLLKCKDFKRKYNKSMAMQNYIKQSMIDRKFKTASELAGYIRRQYNVNCNRSIVSRHLNQMQRDKFEFFGDIEIPQQKLQAQKSDKQKNCTALTKFKRLFFGMKQNFQNFYYISVIKIYYVKSTGKLQIDEQNIQSQDYKAFNIVITSTQRQILSFQSDHIEYLIRTEGTIFKKTKNDNLLKTYYCLYNQVDRIIFNQTFFISNLIKNDQNSFNNNAYCIFPYDNSVQQAEMRKQTSQKIVRNQINMMIMPLKVKPVNFIKNWFIDQVYQNQLQHIKFNSLQNFQHQIGKIMKQNQHSLKNHAVKMMQGIRIL